MIPTAASYPSEAAIHQFQSRNRETYDSNPNLPNIVFLLISLFQSRNRETYDSNQIDSSPAASVKSGVSIS